MLSEIAAYNKQCHTHGVEKFEIIGSHPSLFH
jgi:hypothetical protein